MAALREAEVSEIATAFLFFSTVPAFTRPVFSGSCPILMKNPGTRAKQDCLPVSSMERKFIRTLPRELVSGLLGINPSLRINNLALKGEVCCSRKVVTLRGLIPF
jgi:hypothetical protein